MKNRNAVNLTIVLVVLLVSISFWSNHVAEAEGTSMKDALKNLSNPQEVIIHFLGKIEAKNIAALLQIIDKERLRGTKTFVITLNTTGGDPEIGLAAYNYLKSLPITIITYNLDNVSSAGVYLYCAGSKRYSSPDGYFLFHGVSNSVQNASISALKANVKKNEIYIKGIRNIYSNCMNKGFMDKYDFLKDDVILDSFEAKSVGLVHEMGVPVVSDADNVYGIIDSQ